MKPANQVVIDALRMQTKEWLELAKEKSDAGDVLEAMRLTELALKSLQAIQHLQVWGKQ